MADRKIIDYRVRIQVAEDSPDGVLLDFLKHERHPSFSHKEMVLWALRGYWMAIAFQQRWDFEEAGISQTRMQQIALDGIYQLRQQIAYIETTFKVGLRAETNTSAQNGDPQPKTLTAASDFEPAGRRNDEWYGGQDLFDSSV
jgi:hypothetical protein